jgi:hypothetical protein
MCGNKIFVGLVLSFGLLLLPVAAAAVPGAVQDAHRLPENDEFQNTIEARCTICHTRARVDDAIGEQADLEALMQQMIERGAILSERDQKVLGTFWGSPLKEEQTTPLEEK